MVKTKDLRAMSVDELEEKLLQNKKEQSEMRKQERKIKLAKEECEKIESELEKIDDEIQKYATDYIKTSELWLEKEKLEDRLLELYEFLETDN